MAADPYTRWAAKVDRSDPSGCWLWTASLYQGTGYGQFMYRKGVMGSAHRWAYEYYIGPIPDGLDIDHLCRVRACVNPAHLEAVSRRENLLRGETIPAAKASQTHCKRGHEFTPENTYAPPKRPTNRHCRICQADSLARRRAGGS